ncbi:hypothetical protein SAMN06265348_103530 [Pedobacter westerhofensis]|uniref:Uncharacterized protein n=1 Tax=Pedobacter westerhofensis TaxID=425512 RepID=A0A521CET2_9SPHI|nr:hypothetical protein SAMN06265348_103530 [Pedobacter westerhofensis]
MLIQIDQLYLVFNPLFFFILDSMYSPVIRTELSLLSARCLMILSCSKVVLFWLNF